MRIDSSQIWLTSTRSYRERHEERESLHAWVDSPNARAQTAKADEAPLGMKGAGPVSSQDATACAGCASAGGAGEKKLLLLKSLIEALTGKRIRLLDVRDIPDPGSAEVYARETQDKAIPPASTRERAGWGVEYTREVMAREEENTTVEARGVVRTKDGREVLFSVTLAMERQFESRSRTDFRAGDARKTDPIVINFDGNAAQLTNTKFAFDLNADGTSENVSFVGAGSGMLVLDRNLDGKATDGAELFGPVTGNGFEELRTYDVDANGWLDEDDPVYARLSVWTKDERGNDLLTPLSERGVAALSLSPVSSDFDLRDKENRLLGQVRRTGVYLASDSTVKTIQQVDLTL